MVFAGKTDPVLTDDFLLILRRILLMFRRHPGVLCGLHRFKSEETKEARLALLNGYQS